MLGVAISDKAIEVNDQMTEIMKQILVGRRLAIRIISTTTVDTIVLGLPNVAKVMAPLAKACPLDAAPDRTVPE